MFHDASHALTSTYDDAMNGNVVQTAQLTLGKNGKADLALGFGATQSDAIGAAALPARVTERRVASLLAERPAANPTLDVVERAYILWVLQNEGGNKTRTAEVLGIDPSTLYRKLARYEEAP